MEERGDRGQRMEVQEEKEKGGKREGCCDYPYQVNSAFHSSGPPGR